MKHTNPAIDQLKSIALFSACSSKELDQIARATIRLEFPAGYVLAREGERGRELLVIVDGRASVIIGGQEIANLGAGDFLGEIALLDGGQRTATVIATTDLVAEVIGQREFAAVVASTPHLAGNLLVGLARRLRATDLYLTC